MRPDGQTGAWYCVDPNCAKHWPEQQAAPEVGIIPSTQDKLFAALSQLLHEVIAAGFLTATDYNWPKAIKDAQDALGAHAHTEQFYDKR
jgi:hypothetical protein